LAFLDPDPQAQLNPDLDTIHKSFGSQSMPDPIFEQEHSNCNPSYLKNQEQHIKIEGGKPKKARVRRNNKKISIKITYDQQNFHYLFIQGGSRFFPLC
jgi:hypothetical protein